MLKVLVLQPYVPRYRLPLFEALAALISRVGGEFKVVHGRVPGGVAGREDAIRSEWGSEVRSLALPGVFEAVQLRRYVASPREWLLVTELSAFNLDAWRSLLSHRHPGLIVWGHGRPYVGPERRLSTKLKVELARRASATWTYTATGRDWLVEHGAPAERIIDVGNAADNRDIYNGILASQRQLSAHVALYIGALDASKNIDFLVASADEAHRRDPEFRLVVCGAGAAAPLIANRPWIEPLGRVNTAQKVDLGRHASAIWNPGRIGLVALDALAMGLPVIGTDFPFNAPETDYLTEGMSWFRLGGSPPLFAEAALRLMRESASAPLQPAAGPSCEEVADRMFCSILDVWERTMRNK